jgi:WD40 repeat protein
VHGWSSDGELIAFTRLTGGGRHGELTAYSVVEERTWPLIPAERGSAGLGAGWSPLEDAIAAPVARYDEEGDTDELLVASSRGDEMRGLPLCRFDGAEGDHCITARIVWSPDGGTIAYRGFITGTPLRSVIVLQDVNRSLPRHLHITRTTFYDGRMAGCCLAWLPAA